MPICLDADVCGDAGVWECWCAERCSYEWLLVCLKVSVESCSLFVLADGYEREKKRAGRFRPYTHGLHGLELRNSAALGKRLKGFKHTERRKAAITSGWSFDPCGRV